MDSARGDLQRRGLAIVGTERVRLDAHASQEHGAAVMAALMAVVRSLVSDVEAIIAKGGITSAEVAMTGLGADRAWVRGQLEIGVSLRQVGSTPGLLWYRAISATIRPRPGGGVLRSPDRYGWPSPGVSHEAPLGSALSLGDVIDAP